MPTPFHNSLSSSSALRRRGKHNVYGAIDDVTESTFHEPQEHEPPANDDTKSAAVTILGFDADVVLVVVFSIISCISRTIYIAKSRKVVWDEAHFGKFGSFYIRGQYFSDVHPPLGKMLMGLGGWLAGHNGTFEFPSGETVPENLNIGIWRSFCALFGAAIVPLAYASSRAFRLSRITSTLAASLVLLDNGLTVISRFILLDPPLLCATAWSAFCWSKCASMPASDAFSRKWYLWLFLLGTSLGIVSCIKWVGFFLVAAVGLHTTVDLWNILGDLRVSLFRYLMHWTARVLMLIIVPITVYVALFRLHFALLPNYSNDAAQMSTKFQNTLRGYSNIAPTHLEITDTSAVTFKNTGYGGGLLHSHKDRYPHGSQEQQVTCYHFSDSNNDWRVQFTDPNDTVLRHGSVIELIHVATNQSLNVNARPAPLSGPELEVSARPINETEKRYTQWLVVLVEDDMRKVDKDPNSKQVIHARNSRFRFVNQYFGCYLSGGRRTLPEWGFKQKEVFCQTVRNEYSMIKGLRVDQLSKYTTWNVERNIRADGQPAPDSAFASGTDFFEDLINLSVMSLDSNEALQPDPNAEPKENESKATEWPLLSRGMRMCSWADNEIKYMLFGNPFIWWLAFGALIAYLTLFLAALARRKAHMANAATHARLRRAFTRGNWLAIAAVMHYAPFFIMKRVLYLHHYLPSLYFGILLAAHVFEELTFDLSMSLRLSLCSVLVAVAAYGFWVFAPLTYGLNYPASNFVAENSLRRVMKSWNIA